MASMERPGLKYQHRDWLANSIAVSANSQRQRDASHEVRQVARARRSFTDIVRDHNQQVATNMLNDRVNEIKDVIELLETTGEALDVELGLLDHAKESLAQQLINLQTPKESVNECLTLRDRRIGIDMVEDAAETELKKEKTLLDNLTNNLQEKVNEAFERMRLLKEARAQILIDLEDKNEAMAIDLQQTNLRPDCPGVSFKPNSTRIPEGTVIPEEWFEFSAANIDRGMAENEASRRLREDIMVTLSNSANNIEAQAQATERALRNRKNETEQALDELKWQKQQLENEIAEMIRDLDEIEQSIRDQIPAGKLAQTRLERRTYRPGMELCRDGAQNFLTQDVATIRDATDYLKMTQERCRHSLNALQRQLRYVNSDISRKERSLQLDNNCLDLRRRRMDRGQLELDVDMNSTRSAPSNDSTVHSPSTASSPEWAQNLLQ